MVSESTSSSVRFSTVEIREYPVVLGTNPSTVRGPSVELDWQSQSSKSLDLETYEADRSPRRRRKENELIMTVTVRVNRLLDNGVTFRQINSHTKEISGGSKFQTTRNMKNAIRRTRNSIWKRPQALLRKVIIR